MGDQALQEAIQRAKQLAAKISQNAPVKRTASELEDSTTLGTIKVTAAYEKPINHHNNNNNNNNNNNSHGSGGGPGGGSSSSGGGGGGIAGSSSIGRGGSSNHNSNSYDNDKPPSKYGAGGGSSSGYAAGGGSSRHDAGHTSHYSSNADDRIEIIIPHAVIGLVIGKGGENIKRIQNETGATVRVDPNTVDEKGNKVCTITGTKYAVDEAHKQVASVIENAASNKRPRTQIDGSDQYRMKIPASRTGAIIGKGGETIKSIKQQSGCDIELDKLAKECGPDETVFVIRGTQDKIQKARSLIEARLASRGRDDNRDNSSHHSMPKSVATGANAAPIANVGQQQTAEMAAAWQAYYQQYSTLFNQAGAQPGTPQSVPQADQYLQQSAQQPPTTQLAQQPMSAPSAGSAATTATGATTGQQDYTEQWIEFYLMNGRPDYAEQIIEMKRKQQQAQQQSQPSSI